MTVHTCTMRVEKVCKVREEPAPCLITAQGATGCDGVWQCVAGRLSDKVLAPRSTVVGGVDEMRAGGEGGRERRTRVDLGLLVHASKNERMKVTSDLQVPGPNRSWDPASATPAAH